VKVLDPPEVPERKVFPPRTLLTFLGALLAMVVGIGWVVITDGWEKMDPQDPGKLLVLDMARSVKPQFEYVAQQGVSFTARTRQIFSGLQENSAVRADESASPSEWSNDRCESNS
jgi:hypothetical protein